MADVYEWTLYFDGASKGNPGMAGAGAVLYQNGVEKWARAHFVGEKETNNVAEYTGLVIGLEYAIHIGIRQISIKGDSDLVVKQIKGEYKVKSPTLTPHYIRATQLLTQFEKYNIEHVYRQFNKRADALSNLGINMRNGNGNGDIATTTMAEP
jgi:ribonuclease HI